MLPIDPTLLARFRVTVAEPPEQTGPAPERLSLESDALPLLASPPLRELAGNGSRVTIAFTDGTRPSPDHLLVRMLRSELEAAGVAAADITLLCATGLHRPMSEQEFAEKLGRETMRGLNVRNHSALDTENLVDLGEVNGIPVVTNRSCVETDLLIAVGIVEPHQYAGFSGGAKTVVIGCGGEATIRATHGPGMIEQPGTRLGKTEGNPFQEFVRQAGDTIGLRYVLNVVPDGNGGITAGACGEASAVHDRLSGLAAERCVAVVQEPAHIGIAGVPPSKESNLYQASRSATYLALAEGTPLRPGAPIILPAAIPEGPGTGTGERRFFEILSEAASPRELVERLRREGFPAGAQRAFVLAKVLVDHPVIVAGAEDPGVVRACHMIPAADHSEALDIASAIASRSFPLSPGDRHHLLIVPNGLGTLVRLSTKQ